MAGKDREDRERRNPIAQLLKRLRFLFLRIPDVAILAFAGWLWSLYWPAEQLAPSAFSVLVVSLASCGILLTYVLVRYVWRSEFVGRVPGAKSWGTYFALVIVALYAELGLRSVASAVPLVPGAAFVPQLIMVVALTGAGVVIAASGCRGRVTMMTVVAFLAVQALLVFAFAQTYIYAGFSMPGWDVTRSVATATASAESGPDALRQYLSQADSEQLFGVATAFRTLEHGSVNSPWRSIVSHAPYVDGLCERKNLGSALYLSTITWTTVGYGDLVPAPWMRGISAVESVLGYVFMAALAAVLLRWMMQPCGAPIAGKER